MVEFRRIGKTEDNKYVMSARPATWSAIGIKHYILAVIWIRIQSNPHAFGSVDPDPEVKKEVKSRVN